jgi:hypothetical protein
MINAHTRIPPAVGLSLLLLAWIFIFFFDRGRGSAGVFIDVIASVVFLIAVIKYLTGSVSESERQRRHSEQENHQ